MSAPRARARAASSPRKATRRARPAVQERHGTRSRGSSSRIARSGVTPMPPASRTARSIDAGRGEGAIRTFEDHARAEGKISIRWVSSPRSLMVKRRSVRRGGDREGVGRHQPPRPSGSGPGRTGRREGRCSRPPRDVDGDDAVRLGHDGDHARAVAQRARSAPPRGGGAAARRSRRRAPPSTPGRAGRRRGRCPSSAHARRRARCRGRRRGGGRTRSRMAGCGRPSGST